MENKRRIVIYGGTFDPPHKGHFALIKAALETLRPSVLYVVPAFRSPFKGLPCAPFRERVAMLRDGFKSAGLNQDTRVKIHPLEAERGRLTYTWSVVAFFRKEFPGAELFFLMGSDSLETFHRWKNYRRILASASLVVGAREGFPLKNPSKFPYTRLKGRFPPVSSSGLKTALFAGFGRPGLLKSTEKYINARGLYAAGLRRKVARGMTPARFGHVRAATLLALELAGKYSVDPEKAALAGLLHDAARELGPRGLAAYARVNGLKVPAFKETLRKAPVILHAYAGADMAAKKFGVKDRAVLKAIRSHTLGSPSPGLLDKIIYVSDLAADGRNFPEAGRIRELAFRDLDAAYAAANYVKLTYILKSGGWIHPESIKTWTNLLENRE